MGYTAQVNKKTISLLAAGAAVLAIFAGASSPASAAPATTDVNTLLNGLTVAPESAVAYSRSDFKHWIDQQGCDTRQDVLIRDRQQGVPRACSVIGGKWYSPYDGVTTTDGGTFDIDHMVPLAEAARSGAYNWSADQRMLYANDLGYQGSLKAVSASSNRSKGDKGPQSWMPPNKGYWCTYLKDWVGVKYRWGLSVDPAEKAAIQKNLKGCDPSMATPPVAPVANGLPAPLPTAKPSPTVAPAPSDGKTDPRFRTCGEANKAGYGPYYKATDPEYGWYRDSNKDGKVC